MAEFQPQKKVLTDFNNGQKYNDGDGLNADTINSLVESTLYAQDNVGSGGSGATLTNYDGDSQEEGFTQWYIKRGAQAKNYYNLGAFDEYIPQNDNTTIIRRKTGYITLTAENIDILSPFTGTYPATSYGLKIKNMNFSAIMAVNTPCKLSNYTYVNEIINNGETLYVSVVFNNPVDSDEEAISLVDGLNIEYLLAEPYNNQAEKIIDYSPVRELPKIGEVFINEEWQKTLNYCMVKEIPQGEETIIAKNLPAGIYTFALNENAENLHGQYILSVSGNSYPAVSVQSKITFRITTPKDISIYVNVVNGTHFAMLNRGDTQMPYTPYNGKIIHEKDFNTLATEVSNMNSEIDNLSERLDSLGFKSGSLSYNFNATATQNEVKRQGNYCIINLDITKNIVDGTIPLPQDNDILAVLPSEFEAKGNPNIMALYVHGRALDAVLAYIDCIINGNNIIVNKVIYSKRTNDNNVNNIVGQYDYRIFIKNAGYEALPLNN